MLNQKNSVSNNQTLSSELHHSNLVTKKQELTVEMIVNTVWVSTFLALILTIPSLLIFMGIYFTTGNILACVVVGFGLHFVGLAYSEISMGLLRIVS